MIVNNYKPSQLLVVYKAEVEKSFRESEYRYYIEQHPIISAGTKYMAMSGQPMQIKEVEGVFKALVKDHGSSMRFKSVIPENVLYTRFGSFSNTVIWWEPAQTRTMFFNEKLGMGASFSCAMPAILYMVEGKSLSVFALQEDKRPGPNTPICYLPLPNVYNDCRVCMGTARVKGEHEYAEDLMQDYVYAFWNSEFNAHHADRQRFKGSLLQYMKELDGRPFDSSLLVPVPRKTIKSLINARTYHQ